MRLRRLDLTRYGKFTDRSFDFGPAPTGEGSSDLHVLYGPNEAGKSTLLAGWLDLLYGIPAQSRYNFLHPYSAMRIGAEIEHEGRTLHLVRTKGRTNTLADGAGAPLPQSVAEAALGGIGRAAYQAMFSLDDDTLEAGGESILASDGDLGQLLFSASAGLARLGTTLDGLRGAADAFHRTGARKGELSDLKARLKTLADQRREIDTQASTHARLAAARAAADEAWRTAQDTHAATAARLEKVRRHLAALGPAARLRRIDAERAPLAHLPATPRGWGDELAALTQERTAVAARLDEVAATIAQEQRRHDAAVPDPAVVALRADIDAAGALKPAHDTAADDLPRRREELAEADAQIAASMQRLGLGGRDAAGIVPRAATLGALRALIAARSGIAASLRAARDEHAGARDRKAALDGRLAAAGGGGGDTAALAILTDRLRADDPAQRLRQSERRVAEADAALAPRLAALRPWQGSLADLAALAVPSAETLDGWAATLETAEAARTRASDEIARLSAIVARLEAALAAGPASGHVTPQDAAAARAERERLWSVHLAALTAQTAQDFEAALRLDDQITARQAAAQTEDALRAGQRAELADAGVGLHRAEAAHAQASASADAARAGMATALAALGGGLPGAMGVAALRVWLMARETALEAGRALDAAERVHAQDRAALDTARGALAAALGAGHAETGDNKISAMPYEAMLAHAQALCDAGKGLATLRETHADAAHALDRRARDLALAETAETAWQADWAAACAQTWLAGQPAPDVAQMAAMLDVIETLDRALALRAGLADRIAKMTANADGFVAAARDLGRRLGLSGDDAAVLWPMIAARAADADAARKTRDAAAADLRAARDKHATLAAQGAGIAARIAQMCAHFAVDDLAALHDCLTRAQRRDTLTLERAATAEEICETLQAPDLDAALAATGPLDRAALEAEETRLGTERDALAAQLQQLFADLTEAQRQIDAVGGDDTVARLEAERQTVLLEMEEKARAHLRRRFGIIAVDHALRSYRDTHRSAMMQRASEAFATISRGAYGSLAAQPDGEREVLVALPAEGGSKLARDLSKGTRFQLYLALRVAGYHEFAAVRPPVPFVADDIMETFDDDRSAEAFALLGRMAKVGQVIYLTHHRHLCDMAQAVCGDVRIHRV